MSQHVQDAAVFERRLRPIYDNLESGNNRKALQESEKLLKKQPNFLCAKALKGLALLRLGRYEESNQYLKAVSQEKPTDDSTLQVLSFCYKELEQLHKIVELYTHAAQQTPGNEELLAHLFISHVRLEDFKAQQAVALQLYKVKPKNAYYFWAVMSVVLQATRGPDCNKPEKRKIFLELSQRMTEKLIKENKLKTEQEILIYLNILKLQEKYEEALEFLETYQSGDIEAIPISEKVSLLKVLKRWQDLKKLLKTLLNDEPDRWDYHQEHLACYFTLMDEMKSSEAATETENSNSNSNPNANENENESENDKNTLENCHEFICQLIETAPKKMRGPYMARLELHKRMRERNLNAQELLGDFGDLIIEYFRLFGDKTCCTHDIALFLDSITIKERQEIASKLLLESGISSTTLPQNKEQMQKHICALQISRICGSHIDLEVEHLLAFYTALKLHYEHGLSSFGQNLLPTDMGPSDPYALLAANVMFDLSMKEQKADYLFEALCLLQYVLSNSTSNFHVKLLSLKIYHMFGCVLGANEMYEYLEIKQIQLDSMGYMHCNLLPLSGRLLIARSVFDTTLRFFTASYKERFEYVGLIYRFCTFSKLEEFMNFKERLTNSLHYVAMSVEAQLSDIVTFYGNVKQNLTTYNAMSIDPADDRINWNELSDNRDLSALVRFDPKHLINLEAEKKESFDQEVEVLQIRSLLLRLVASYIDLFHEPPSGKYTKKPSQCCTSSTKLSADVKTNDKNSNTTTAAHINNHNSHNDSDDAELNGKETDVVELLSESWSGLFQRIRAMNYKPLPNQFLVNLLPTRLHLLLNMPYEKFFSDLSQFVLDLFNDSNNLPTQSETIQDHIVNLVDICTQTIEQSNAAQENALWHRREIQNKVAAVIEILSLYTFVLTALNDKIQTINKTKSKKKAAAEKKEKDRAQVMQELVRQLKAHLENCETLIGNWKAPVLPRDLNSCMSDLSLKPEVEANLIADVAAMFKDSHDMMVTETKSILKDKIRMLLAK